jgi:hypothetical protein
MSATSTSQDSLRRWNVASSSLLGLYLLSLVVFAVAVRDDGVVRAIGLGAYANPRA